MKGSPKPQLQKLDGGVVMAVLYIGLAVVTKDMFISYGIIPGDVLK